MRTNAPDRAAFRKGSSVKREAEEELEFHGRAQSCELSRVTSHGRQSSVYHKEAVRHEGVSNFVENAFAQKLCMAFKMFCNKL